MEKKLLGFVEDLQLKLANKAVCANTVCPVPRQIRKELCTFFDIADSTGVRVDQIINPDFRADPVVECAMLEEHCLPKVRQCDGWQNAVIEESSDGGCIISRG